MNDSNYIFVILFLIICICSRVSTMSAYISPLKFAVWIIMPLSATVCSSPAAEGACPQSAGGEPGKYILTGFSPVAELWAFSWCPDFQLVPGLSVGARTFSWCPDFQLVPWISAGTLCGTLNFGWHPGQHNEVPRVTSHRRNSPLLIFPESPHDSLSRSSHTPWTASASSLWLGIYCFLNTWPLLPRTEATNTS